MEEFPIYDGVTFIGSVQTWVSYLEDWIFPDEDKEGE